MESGAPASTSHALEPNAALTPASPRARRQWSWLFWNAGERRPRAVLRILAQHLLLVLLIAVAAGLAWALKLRRPGIALATPMIALASWISVWLAGRFIDRRSWREFGLQMDRAWWYDMSFGLVLGALLMTLGFEFERAMGWLHVERVVDLARPGAFVNSLARGLALFVAVGFYEELLARGYLLRNVAEGLRGRRVSAAAALVGAALLTALLFGVGHGGNPGATLTSTVNITVAGLLLALPYVLTGRLAVSIGFHITWNLFQGPIFGFPVSGNPLRDSLITIRQAGPEVWTGGGFGPEAGLVGLVLMALGALLMLAWIRWRDARLGLHVALAMPPQSPNSTASVA